jgi:hypothetical protein
VPGKYPVARPEGRAGMPFRVTTRGSIQLQPFDSKPCTHLVACILHEPKRILARQNPGFKIKSLITCPNRRKLAPESCYEIRTPDLLQCQPLKAKGQKNRPKPFAAYELLRGEVVMHSQAPGKKSQRKESRIYHIIRWISITPSSSPRWHKT